MRRFATTLLCLVSAASVTASDAYYSVLYGFKIGQPITNALEVLGEPSQVHPFPDGWQAYVFQLEGLNLVLEVSANRPDLIVSIQITGPGNPEGLGLGSVELGDSLEDALAMLGEPDRQEIAMDAITQQPIAGTAINFYGAGMSFDQRDGVVTSIKVIYGGPAEVTPTPDISRFFAVLRDHDYYGLAEMIAGDMTIGPNLAVPGSMLQAIAGDTPLHRLLYGEGGLAGVDESVGSDGALRNYDGGRVGYVVQLSDRSVSELVFTRSFEGWVLWQANLPVSVEPEPEPEPTSQDAAEQEAPEQASLELGTDEDSGPPL